MEIDREDYDAISKWISKANNFVCSETDQEGCVSWYVLRHNCQTKIMELVSAEVIHTTTSPEIYIVDTDVYTKWKQECGYVI